MERTLQTSRGILRFPTFMPVTTFGRRFPLDAVVRPYLDRLTSAMLVSHHYAQAISAPPSLPLFIDSGGFASLFEGTSIVDAGDIATIQTREGDIIHPKTVLDFQEKHADIGATLDFLIPPNLDPGEARKRQEYTIKNAIWAINHRSRTNFRLYASIQAWGEASAENIMRQLVAYPFDGFALGGMVPRIRTPQIIFDIVHSIRKIDADRPLHVFGIGHPSLIKTLFEHGVDSVDSSSYVRMAADKRYLNPKTGQSLPLTDISDVAAYCSCRLCQTFNKAYMNLPGELNTMPLALHNLTALNQYLGLNERSDLHSAQQTPPHGAAT